MIPGEFIVVGAIAVGITAPVAFTIESLHPPVDMTRYEIRKDCVLTEGVVVPTCLFDSVSGHAVGAI